MESTKAAENCGLTNKEMKITFNEYCRFHPSTYDESTELATPLKEKWTQTQAVRAKKAYNIKI